jgi:NAD(P)-dependent dehydrogenase (short-subunit alcohol dehydrogenase family)
MGPKTEWDLVGPRSSPSFVEAWLALVALLRSGRAPRGLRVRGSLPLSHLRLRSLPAGLEVEGALDLRCCERLRRIGAGLRVGGDLSIGGGAELPAWLAALEDRIGPPSRDRFAPLRRLPDRCRVGGDLALVNCHRLEALPDDLEVGGALGLSGCRSLRALPPGLRVAGDLSIARCDALAALPDGLRVDGSLRLRRCAALAGWPAGLSVEGDLVISGCRGLPLLPRGLRVAGSVRLERGRGTPAGAGLLEQARSILAATDLDELGRGVARLHGRLRRARRRARKERDLKVVRATGRVCGAEPVGSPSFTPLQGRRRCYICDARYDRIHAFYHMLCPDCAALNYERRHRRGDLRGRVALVTGGRVKIGYQVALKLLRDGASVRVTTRFAENAALRFHREDDRTEWWDRLRIHPLDLRSAPAVLALVEELSRALPHLDVLVNNAAQTVRRPDGFYREHEALRGRALPETVARAVAGPVALLEGEGGAEPPLPPALPDPEDRREHNSWSMRLHQVPPAELLEALLVNTAAPFYLTAGLRGLMERSPFPDRYVVNVCGPDGQFSRPQKGPEHPHVNMTKAALNMMTRTAAADLAGSGVHLVSVDTGWVSVEGPYGRRKRLEELGFVTPLDAVDGAARIYDPILRGLDGEPVSGLLLRHYAPAPW